MKVRKVGRDFTKGRIEIDLERRDGNVLTVLKEHWSEETDPLRMAAEAVKWLRDGELPEMVTPDRSLSERLRSDHGVKLDSVDYFAGRVIDQWVELELRPSIPVAVELGVLYALFNVYRRLDETRKKPRKVRPRSWVDAVAGARVGMGASDRERWEIPEDFEVFTDDGTRWLVSREEDEKKDGERIERFRAYPGDNRRAPEWGPSCRGFERYLARARKRRRRKQSR